MSCPKESCCINAEITLLDHHSCNLEALNHPLKMLYKSASSHLAVITGLEELWKQLADAKETNGFLELPDLILEIFPDVKAGKLLVLDSYKNLLRIIEQRSGAKLASGEAYFFCPCREARK